MHHEPDHFLLRRYHVARAQGDLAQAAQIWEQLAVQNFDRIKQIVKAFRYSPGRGIPEFDQGAFASEAYLRVVAMGVNFREQTTGQLYAAIVSTVRNTCLDQGRKELRHETRAAGSVDDTFDSESDAGRYDAALAAHDAELRERATDAVENELHAQYAHELVAWGISRMENDNHREVLELTYLHKLSAQEISDQLGISMDNVYARRSRGVRELEKILRDFRS